MKTILGILFAVATLGCASANQTEATYALRYRVNVTSNPSSVSSCRRIEGIDINSAPCATMIVGGGQTPSPMDCARYWTVREGGDTLLVGSKTGDIYLCKAPIQTAAK
ncbi:MAG TPA: hypothetical protein PLB01_00080 [Thermoanaerobaculia bacterium]|nr:hypothetical protein [Thermoanaerobaculia bacterium]